MFCVNLELKSSFHIVLLFTDFGDEDILSLQTQFKDNLVHADVDIGVIDSEWTVLKKLVYRKYVI
jgi:hypothetical protein